MSSRVQVRGCCCGIPFGCGVLALPILLAFGAAPVALALAGVVAGGLTYGAIQLAREPVAIPEA